MEQKQLIFISIFSTAIALLTLGYLLVSPPAKSPVNKNILALTQPVTTFSGTVKQISGNYVTLDRMVTQPANENNTSVRITPTPAVMHIDYRVQITGTTHFNQTTDPIDYESKTGLPQSPLTPSVQNIRVNDWVTVTTKTDLRTLTGDTFVADNVTLPPIEKYLTGTVSGKEPNTLIIHGTAGTMVAAEQTQSALNISEQDFTVTMSSATKTVKHIYSADIKQPVVTAAVPWDGIPTGTHVTVYTDKPITGDSDITAVYVEYSEQQAFLIPTIPPASNAAGLSAPVLPTKP